MRYRAEIDGLRAVAVLPVIFFHAGFESVRGGFVGVDIFFVISGYLITGILLAELAQERYSIATFYERRARRILPALFVVLAACLPFAWAGLLPDELHAFGHSLLGVALFASNIVFWQESGYFDTVAELKPLLHTWSLAVEEQFYLLFPLALAALWRFGRRLILPALVLISVISLAAAQWSAAHTPVAGFFLLPTRAWELALGALAAWWLQRQADVDAAALPLAVRQGLSLAGLLALFASMLLFGESTPFPSVHTLLPVSGAVLIILFAGPDTWVGRLLAQRLLVGVGLISYSAYLWHQPLFAFARHLLAEHPGRPVMLALVAATLALAWLSWRFVERPFRDRSRFDRRQVFVLALAGSVALLAAGAALSRSSGALDRAPRELAVEPDYRWSQHVRAGHCHLQQPHEERHADDCLAPGAPHVMAVWGDSHAASLAPGLARLVASRGDGWAMAQLTEAACGPIFDLPLLLFRSNCNRINEAVLARLAERPPELLVIHAAWQHRQYPLEPQELPLKVRQSLERIKSTLPRTRIVVIGPVPHWTRSPQADALTRWKLGETLVADAQGQRRQKARVLQPLDDQLRAVAHDAGVEYISLSQMLCDTRGCVAKVGPQALDWIAIDREHFSWSGANFVAARLAAPLMWPASSL